MFIEAIRVITGKSVVPENSEEKKLRWTWRQSWHAAVRISCRFLQNDV